MAAAADVPPQNSAPARVAPDAAHGAHARGGRAERRRRRLMLARSPHTAADEVSFYSSFQSSIRIHIYDTQSYTLRPYQTKG